MSTDDPTLRLATYPVREMMVPLVDYPKVGAHQTVRKAIKIMDAARLSVAGRSSLPRLLLVLDEGDRLVGIVRRRDVLRALTPGFMKGAKTTYSRQVFDVGIDPNLAELSMEAIVRDIRRRAERPVSEVMRPPGEVIDEDDHILKAVSLMVSSNRALLPVVRGDRVVGVVRSADMFRELAQLIL